MSSDVPYLPVMGSRNLPGSAAGSYLHYLCDPHNSPFLYHSLFSPIKPTREGPYYVVLADVMFFIG